MQLHSAAAIQVKGQHLFLSAGVAVVSYMAVFEAFLRKVASLDRLEKQDAIAYVCKLYTAAPMEAITAYSLYPQGATATKGFALLYVSLMFTSPAALLPSPTTASPTLSHPLFPPKPVLPSIAFLACCLPNLLPDATPLAARYHVRALSNNTRESAHQSMQCSHEPVQCFHHPHCAWHAEPCY